MERKWMPVMLECSGPVDHRRYGKMLWNHILPANATNRTNDANSFTNSSCTITKVNKGYTCYMLASCTLPPDSVGKLFRTVMRRVYGHETTRDNNR